jgi:hypothetical protein
VLLFPDEGFLEQHSSATVGEPACRQDGKEKIGGQDDVLQVIKKKSKWVY